MNTLRQKESITGKLNHLHYQFAGRGPTLEINRPGDSYEQEADEMAESVINMTSNKISSKHATGLIGNSIFRKCEYCEEEEKKKRLMRKTDNSNRIFQSTASLASSLKASKGGGVLLPKGIMRFMENAFSTDFSSVRVHTDNNASEMSKGIHAKAFTHGHDIYFRNGEYSTGTVPGKKLLAHELTHVVQQAGAVSRHMGIQRQNDGAEAQNTGTCYPCQIPGGLGVCCPAADMPLVPECWKLATNIIDNCPGDPTNCITQAKCAQCQCVAAIKGERYCTCTGIV